MPDDELARQRAFLRQVIDLNPSLIFAKDREGRFTLVNQAVATIYGTTVEALIGKTDADFNPNKDEVEFFRKMDLEVMNSLRRKWIPEEVVTDAAGEQHWLQTMKIPIVESDGTANQILGVATDITERKRAEEALRESEERFRKVAAATHDLIFDWDVASDRLWHNWSPHPEEGTGTTIEGGFGWFIERLHPADRDRVKAMLDEAFASTQEGLGYEYRFRRADGSYATTLARLHFLRDAAGKIVRLLGAATDITEQRRLEDQLRQAQKMEAIGRLAGGVAHDFNNFLLVILGFTDRILRGLEKGEAVRNEIQLLRLVKAAGEKAGALTRQLLAFSRKQVFQPAVLDLSAVVRGMEPMLRRLIGEDVELVVRAAPALGRVRADPAQIEQVVMNLAVNARDAMPGGGKLAIDTSDARIDERTASAVGADARPGEYVALTVTDTGCGMDQATLALIFEPFFTTKGVGKGTGLGLSTVYGIVRQSGGFIAVTSEPDAGSCFKVFLPRVEEPVAAAESARAPGEPRADARRGTETVLLVEDDELVRTYVKTALEDCGYSVIAARDGDDALRQADRHSGPIHLLLTDVVMPRMSGQALAERMAAARPATKIMFMSAHTDDAVVLRGAVDPAPAGRAPFLQKPFTIEQLAARIREVLDGALSKVT